MNTRRVTEEMLKEVNNPPNQVIKNGLTDTTSNLRLSRASGGYVMYVFRVFRIRVIISSFTSFE